MDNENNEKDNMGDMIVSLFNQDKEEFYSAFNSEMGERIGEKLVDKHLDISSDIIHTTEEEEES